MIPVVSLRSHAPLVISASRSTDIPAFYADWFFDRLKTGASLWRNPFSPRQIVEVSYQQTRFIVFWSKNPAPLLSHLDSLKNLRPWPINCYIHYTLNDYGREGYESGLATGLSTRVDVFKKLVDKLGPDAVIWRSDPLLLDDDGINVDTLLERLEHVGDSLQGYARRMIFSFIDIERYSRVKANLRGKAPKIREFTIAEKLALAAGLRELNKKWQLEIASCAESVDLTAYGIKASHCIDDELMAKLAHEDEVLMDYLGFKIIANPAEPRSQGSLLSQFPEPRRKGDIFPLKKGVFAQRVKNYRKDPGQRRDSPCGCSKSKDIGQYNTCMHLCAYCYANFNDEVVARNYLAHSQNPRNGFIAPFSTYTS